MQRLNITADGITTKTRSRILAIYQWFSCSSC